MPEWLSFIEHLFIIVAVPTALTVLRSQLGPDKTDLLTTLAAQAVRSVEQQYSGSATGSAKKQAALQFLTDLVNWRGLKVDEAALDHAIEAAVYDLNKWAKSKFGTGLPLPVNANSTTNVTVTTPADTTVETKAG